MIIGIGIDVIEVEKIATGIRRATYRRKVFTPAEIADCLQSRNSAERFAGKFVAKEACMKAMGAGIRQRVQFTDIEVLNEQTGQPRIRTAHHAGRILETLGVTGIHISISHSAGLAVGVVVLDR